MKIVIVGGGASSLLAASKLKNNHEVTIIESLDKLGKKILMTGNGKCNYWNDLIGLNKYNTDSPKNLEIILNRKDECLDYLYKLGLYPSIKNGYYYPLSMEASTVLKILESNLDGVNIVTNCTVKEIKKNNKGTFIINTNLDTYTCDKVIIATGSYAYSKLDIKCSGYKLLEKLGHTINNVMPSLVQLKTKYKYQKELDGVRINGRVSLKIDNKIFKEETGEIQFTDYGISGICTFNVSSLANKYLSLYRKVIVELDLFPEDFYLFMERRSNYLDKTLYESMYSLFNHKLLNVIFMDSKIDKNKRWIDLSEDEKNLLTKYVNNFELVITGSNDFTRGQVCRGGVSLNEINPNTMESKLVKDLYILGEVLDVDGDCGGYNLSFAFMTGFIVGDI